MCIRDRCGLAITVVSAVFISLGQFWLGGVLLLTGSLFDLIDGSLARKLGQDSKFGALLDSVVDRLSETVILLGLLIFYIGESSNLAEILVYVAVSGSLMVSYLRCLLYTSPSPRDRTRSRMPSSA